MIEIPKKTLVISLLVVCSMAACLMIFRPPAAVRFSSSRLYLNDNGGRIYSSNFLTKKTLVKAESRTVHDMAVSLDGRFLYYVANYDIRRIALATVDESGPIEHPLPQKVAAHDKARIDLPHDIFPSFFSVSPDEKYIALVEIDCINTAAGEKYGETEIPDIFKHIPHEVRMPPNLYENCKLHVLEIETGKCLNIADRCDIWRASWTPDSQAIVFGAENMIHKYNLADGGIVSLREGSFPSLSPDGSKIAYFFDGKLCWGSISSEEPEHGFDYVKDLGVWWPGRNLSPLSVWSPDGEYLLLSTNLGYRFIVFPPFIEEHSSSDIHILDANTGKVKYRDKIPHYNRHVFWAKR